MTISLEEGPKRYRVYYSDGQLSGTPPVPDVPVEIRIWRPGLTSFTPAGVSRAVYATWWTFHYARLFTNRDYFVAQGFLDGRVVYSLAFFPRWYRFSFMGSYDLQIGDGWTDPRYRGKHIHPYVMRYAVEASRAPGRRFWGIIDESNIPPIRGIERAGFRAYALAVAEQPLGSRILKRYRLVEGAPVTEPRR